MNKQIAFLQSFGIFLVVLGHSEIAGTYLFNWIYSFHMPLFMFISGYLFSLTNDVNNINITKFLKKKIIRLIIPYIVISSLAWIPKYLLNKFAIRPVELNFYFYIHGLLYPKDNPIIFFWFLPTLFLIMLLSIFILKIIKQEYLFLLVGFLLGIFFIKDISFLNISNVFYYLFYFLLGVFLEKMQKKKKYIIIDKSVCLFVLIFLCVMVYYSHKLELFSYVKILYKYINAILGIIFSLGLSNIYLYKNYTFFSYIDGKSYSIYLLSWFPQVFIRLIFFQLLNINYLFGVVLSLIGGIYIPVYINILVLKLSRRYHKTKFLKILFGV